MPRRIVAMTPSEPPMIMFVMKPAIAPRTIHAMMPITAIPPLGCGLGRGTNFRRSPGGCWRMRVIRYLSAVRRPSAGVLDVGHALLSTALNLLDLALGFLVPVAGQLAETFLDFPLGLICGAFGAQVSHLTLL